MVCFVIHRMDERKSKKDTVGKAKSINGKTTDHDKTNDVADEEDLGLEAIVLKEILGADEATRVAKQLNTQLGISYKKQPMLGEIKKKDGIEVKVKKGKESAGFKSKEERLCTKHGKKENGDVNGDSTAAVDVNSNNDCDTLGSPVEGETIVISSKPLDEELTQKISALRQGMSNCHIMVIDNSEDSPEFTVADFETDKEMFSMKCDVDQLQFDTEKVQDVPVKAGTLKKCWNCDKQEPTRKAFKKCQK